MKVFNYTGEYKCQICVNNKFEFATFVIDEWLNICSKCFCKISK